MPWAIKLYFRDLNLILESGSKVSLPDLRITVRHILIEIERIKKNIHFEISNLHIL